MQIKNRKDQARWQRKRLKRQARRKVNLEAYKHSVEQKSFNAFRNFLESFNAYMTQQKTLEETSGGENATDEGSSSDSGSDD